MTYREIVLDTLRRAGHSAAEALQKRAPDMTGTELYAESHCVPDFDAVIVRCNMLSRPVGFVCRSPSGRLVRLLQPYDSEVYTGNPESLSAQWGFVWSKNPADALPFVALATSPYMKDDCCLWNGRAYRSIVDNNVWPPDGLSGDWEEANIAERSAGNDKA